MALEKTIKQESNVQTLYHRLEAVHGIRKNEDYSGAVETYEEHYLSAEDRNNGASPVSKERRNLKLEPLEVAIIWFVLYRGPLKRKYENADNIIEQGDPNLVPLVDMLEDWELEMLKEKVDSEYNERGLGES